jgi:hypothetical protein
MRKSSFVFLIVGATAPVLTQMPPPPKSSASPTPAAEVAYTIETLRTRVRFENDGTGTREMSFSVKVLDEQAVRQWGQIPLAYQSESEDLGVRHVQVQKPDGSSSSTGDAGVQDLAVRPPGPISIFLDLRHKAITVSALRPGDLLTVDAVWTTKKPIAPGQFRFEHSFDTQESVRDELLEIDLPAAADGVAEGKARRARRGARRGRRLGLGPPHLPLEELARSRSCRDVEDAAAGR